MEYHYKPKSQGIDRMRAAFLLGAILVIVVIALVSYKPPEVIIPTTTTTETPTTTTQIETTGNVIIAVKDAKKRVPIVGVVWAMDLVVSEISIHKSAGGLINESETNETGEWITIFEGSKSFDLIALQNVSGILADAKVSPGKYTQIRMTISSGSIRITNEFIAAFNKTYPMVVPSESLKFIHPFEVELGKTTVLTIDFDVEKSIEKLDNRYLLKPTVAIIAEKLEKGQELTNSVRLLDILDSGCVY